MSKTQKHLAHLLHIPMITTQSLPQLRKSMRLFVQDPLVPKLPKLPREAFTRLADFNLQIAFLSLETPDRVDAAIKFISGLNLNKILHDVTRSSYRLGLSAARRSEPNASTLDNHRREINPASGFLAPPLSVRLWNLSAGHRESYDVARKGYDFSTCQRLFVTRHDTTPRLRAFRQALQHLLNDAGFLEDPGPESWPQRSTHKIMDLNHLTKIEPTAFLALEKENGSLMTLDVTEIIKKYRNIDWTEEFQLERLSISHRLRPTRQPNGSWIGRRQDIMSVPLPGATSWIEKDLGDLTLLDLATRELGHD